MTSNDADICTPPQVITQQVSVGRTSATSVLGSNLTSYVAGNVGCISDVQCIGMAYCCCFSDTVSHERLIQSDSDRNDDG